MVHQYKSNGYNIVLDVCSGSVHVVDDLVYDIIANYENHTKEQVIELLPSYDKDEVSEAYDEVTGLVEDGTLFTEDIFKDYIIDFKKRKSLDFLVANSGNRVNLEVDFFGGEPLMNWDVVKETVRYGRSLEEKHNKKFRFTLTTNGVLLNDEVMEFANKEMANVVLSIDGRKEIHDYMRPTRNGKGSYDLLLPKFQEFAKKRAGKSYYVRGTYTHNNLDFSKDVLHMADLGFDQIPIEPVVSLPDEPYAIKEEDIPYLLDQYDILAKEMIKRHKEGRGFNFFHFMIDLTGGPCVAKRLSGCGSGTEYLSVTPWGDLYPCHQFVGEDGFCIGNVNEGITKPELVDEFKLCNVYAKDKCKDCFARFYCSGGCAANSYKFHGNILDAYDIGCELQKKRIECAIMIKAALADEEENQ